MESLGNSRTSHSDTRVVKPEYLTRLFNRLLRLMAVECGLTKHESSGAVPRKIPKSPQLQHYQWLHRPATQRYETGENASWAGPGGIWLLVKIACLAAASAVMPSHKPCVVDEQRCQAHFTVMETKAHQSSAHSCHSNHRGGAQREKSCFRRWLQALGTAILAAGMTIRGTSSLCQHMS